MISATSFTYDGINFMTKYNLLIADFDTNNVGENEAFSPSLSLLKVPGLLRFFHGGVGYEGNPTFEFSVVSQNVIPPLIRSDILSHLIGRKQFLPLQFHGFADLEPFTFYCVFTGSKTIYVNGYCHGFRLTASFDSPYARGKSTQKIITNASSSAQTVIIKNLSDIIDDYTYPTVQFNGPFVEIINTTDDSTRAFSFSGLNSNEIVTVNNETKIIESTLGGEKLSNFTTKNWLRLRRGDNILRVRGNGNVTITCPYYAMIGY